MKTRDNSDNYRENYKRKNYNGGKFIIMQVAGDASLFIIIHDNCFR